MYRLYAGIALTVYFTLSCPQHGQLLNGFAGLLRGQLREWQRFSRLRRKSYRPLTVLGWHHLAESKHTPTCDSKRNTKWYTHTHTHTTALVAHLLIYRNYPKSLFVRARVCVTRRGRSPGCELWCWWHCGVQSWSSTAGWSSCHGLCPLEGFQWVEQRLTGPSKNAATNRLCPLSSFDRWKDT